LADDAPGRDRVFAAKDRTGIVTDRLRSVRTRDMKYIRNYTDGIPYLPLNRYTMLVEPTLAVMQTHEARTKSNDWVSKYMGSKRPAEELYDLTEDPYELHNLAMDPAYEGTLSNFQSELRTWIKDTQDQGEQAEDPTNIETYGKWLEGYLGKIRRQMGVDDLSGEAMYTYWLNKYDLK